ncbi:MAG: hypothetical protein Q4P32_08885 [Micrococcales bacterium]|nr:hypothetical protein [Micrococcales bacterium]
MTQTVAGAPTGSRRPVAVVAAVALALSLGGLTAGAATAAAGAAAPGGEVRPQAAAAGAVLSSGFDLQVPPANTPAPALAPEAAAQASPVNLPRAFAVAGSLYTKVSALAPKPAANPAAKAGVSTSTRAQLAAARTPAASRSTTRVSASMQPRDIGRALATQKGWSGKQFACLEKLWTKESDWTAVADNPSSSAYGIPQALPGHRMASEGRNWRTDPVVQIRWGLKYIDQRYGSPCSAWAHSRATNWY